MARHHPDGASFGDCQTWGASAGSIDFSQLSPLVSIAIREMAMSSTIASPTRRSHQISSYVVAVMAALALVMSGSTSAHAATAEDVVTIGTISNQTIPFQRRPLWHCDGQAQGER